MAALTLSDLQSLRDSLIRARLGGVREVRDQNGETVVYKSDREMASAIANVEARIAELQRGSPINVVKFDARKGV